MHGGIIEFDALPDADGAGAQHHDHRLAGAGEGARFAFLIEAGIEVGRFGGKFRAAGIHHLERRAAFRQVFSAGDAPERRVRIAQLLAAQVALRRKAGSYFGFIICELFEFMDEPAVDLCNRMDLIHAHAAL